MAFSTARNGLSGRWHSTRNPNAQVYGAPVYVEAARFNAVTAAPIIDTDFHGLYQLNGALVEVEAARILTSQGGIVKRFLVNNSYKTYNTFSWTNFRVSFSASRDTDSQGQAVTLYTATCRMPSGQVLSMPRVTDFTDEIIQQQVALLTAERERYATPTTR